MKIAIIGNSGSGKTWLAKHLAKTIQAPLIHLDELFWEANGFNTKRPHADVSQLIEHSLAQQSWIVEGVFGALAAHYLPDADLLIWLDMEGELCEQRLRQRGSESQLHMGREQSELSLSKLINWASTYRDRRDDCSFHAHQAIFSNFTRLRFCLKNEREVDGFLTELSVNRSKS